MSRSLEHLAHSAACVPTLLLIERGVDSFAFENEWQEDCLAPPLFVFCETREAIPAINEFFDCEFQGLILCHRDQAPTYRTSSAAAVHFFPKAFCVRIVLAVVQFARTSCSAGK